MIFIGLIFNILFYVWILIGDKGRIILGYIYEERTWTIPSLVAILIMVIILHFSKKHKPSIIIPHKKSLVDTFEEEDISPFELEKEERQALSTYLLKERADIFHSLAPGSTTLLIGDIVGGDELFIHLPWTNYQGAVRSEELIGYLIHVLSQAKRILLLGEPGQGKTTVLKRVFTIMADRFLQGSSDVVPIYIPLRGVTYLSDESGGTLLLLWKFLRNKQNPFPMSYKHFYFSFTQKLYHLFI